jgi:hypothetical protein
MTNICTRGQEIYDRKFKTRYDAEANGKYAAIDVGSESIYIFDSFLSLGSDVLSEAPHNAHLFVMRVGSPALFTIG